MRPYQDEDEEKIIEALNPFLIEQLQRFLKKLPSMGRESSLEVACGKGYVTREVFFDMFQDKDMFDHHPDAILDSKKQFEGEARPPNIMCYRFQNFHWNG